MNFRQKRKDMIWKIDDWVGWWNKINNKVKENIIDIISIDEFVEKTKYQGLTS